MTKKIIATVLFLPILFYTAAQKKDSVPDLSKGGYVITNLQEDTVKLRDKASQTLRALRNGAVIVRLKTNEKSIEAYRKAGRNDIAEKIVMNRKLQNEKMYMAFLRSFKFCRVYFIYANQTKVLLDGNYKVFLNSNLEVDTSIVFKDTTFVFCEYGSVESFSKFQGNAHPYPISISGSDMHYRVISNKIFDTVPTQTSTSPATTSGLFFSDKNLKQFYRPFPYVEGVYLDNFSPAVIFLNAKLFKEYGLLVELKDYNNRKKEMRKEKERGAEKKTKPEVQPIQMSSLKIIDVGLKKYSDVLRLQEELFSKNIDCKLNSQPTENYLILCEHESVFTLGKSGKRENILVSDKKMNAEFYRVNRGGDVTFHGPGQLVAYPILDLDLLHIGLAQYIFNLEGTIIESLKPYGLNGERIEGAAGIWIKTLDTRYKTQDNKIGAIGVKASRNITMHGLAVNINTDLSYFDKIVPCGLEGKGTTSLQKELGKEISMGDYKKVFVEKFCGVFSFNCEPSAAN